MEKLTALCTFKMKVLFTVFIISDVLKASRIRVICAVFSDRSFIDKFLHLSVNGSLTDGSIIFFENTSHCVDSQMFSDAVFKSIEKKRSLFFFIKTAHYSSYFLFIIRDIALCRFSIVISRQPFSYSPSRVQFIFGSAVISTLSDVKNSNILPL